jgi:hypothetical protein
MPLMGRVFLGAALTGPRGLKISTEPFAPFEVTLSRKISTTGAPFLDMMMELTMLSRLFVNPDVQTWKLVPTQLVIDSLNLHATPRLKIALVKVGFSSKARRYASTASSGLPPLASVAPSRFHNK